MTFAARRALFVACTALGLAWAPEASGQARTLPIEPGTRVRVTGVNMVAPLIANFLRQQGDTAFFIEDAAGRGIWSLHLSEIRKLEKSDGEQRRNRTPMLRGALIGAGLGLFSGLVIANNVEPSDNSREYNKLGMGALFGAVGGLIGAGVGSRFVTERWTPVPLTSRTAGAGPVRGGVSRSFVGGY